MAKLAPSLVRGRAAIDGVWPDRDRRSDGWIADDNHTPPSDHIPDPSGWVHAIDVDKDGLSVRRVLVAAQLHPSVRYIIHRDRIWSDSRAFLPLRYNGTFHGGWVHVSIHRTEAARQSQTRWRYLSGVPGWAQMSMGASGNAVREMQAFLNGWGLSLALDADWGPKTDAAFRHFQRMAGLKVDGICGPFSRAALAR